VLNFIATDLQLYKIFQIMRVSFFGTHCTRTATEIQNKVITLQHVP